MPMMLKKLKQENHKFGTSLGLMVRPCLKQRWSCLCQPSKSNQKSRHRKGTVLVLSCLAQTERTLTSAPSYSVHGICFRHRHVCFKTEELERGAGAWNWPGRDEGMPSLWLTNWESRHSGEVEFLLGINLTQGKGEGCSLDQPRS